MKHLASSLPSSACLTNTDLRWDVKHWAGEKSAVHEERDFNTATAYVCQLSFKQKQVPPPFSPIILLFRPLRVDGSLALVMNYPGRTHRARFQNFTTEGRTFHLISFTV